MSISFRQVLKALNLHHKKHSDTESLFANPYKKKEEKKTVSINVSIKIMRTYTSKCKHAHSYSNSHAVARKTRTPTRKHTHTHTQTQAHIPKETLNSHARPGTPPSNPQAGRTSFKP